MEPPSQDTAPPDHWRPDTGASSQPTTLLSNELFSPGARGKKMVKNAGSYRKFKSLVKKCAVG